MKTELPKLVKTMYEGYKKWSIKNFEETISNKGSDIEKLLNVFEVLDIWSNSLQDCEAAKKLMPEIFIDSYMSVHFVCLGLYKYAFACLRSQLETTLRLVFFSSHPVEFNWWLEGNEYYRSGLQTKDVWGESYNYFANMDLFKQFDKECKDKMKLLSNGGQIKRHYSRLSKYVHSSPSSFQIQTNKFSPNYNIESFHKWQSTFSDIHDLVNIFFILGFEEKYKMLDESEKEKILKYGISSKTYTEIIKKLVK